MGAGRCIMGDQPKSDKMYLASHHQIGLKQNSDNSEAINQSNTQNGNRFNFQNMNHRGH